MGARLGIAAIAALVVLTAPGVASAQAPTITPTRFDDPSATAPCVPTNCSLRQALMAGVQTGVTVNLLPGNYELSQLNSAALTLHPGTVINGAGASVTTIDANSFSRVLFVVESSTAVTVNDVTITGGNAAVGQQTQPGLGGGIFIQDSAGLNLNRSAVVGNSATSGGGISTDTNGLIEIASSTVSGNVASNIGGGIAIPAQSRLRVVNSTLSANQIVGSRLPAGAAIYAIGALELQHVTIAGNMPGGIGAGSSLALPAGQPVAAATINNTIVAADTGAACAVARPKAGTHNLDDDGSCAFGAAGDKPGVNPLLGPLQNNGGPTSTRALLPGSPAIGGGNPATCSGLDQRGVLRPQQGTCDIGAFEYVAPRLRVVTQVVNDHGGTRDAADFTVHVRAGADVAGSPQPGSANGTNYTLGGGAYTVSADPLAKYVISVAGNCAANGVVTLDDSDAKTCTIVANDPAPQAGRNVNALPKSGTVRVKLPGRRRFRRLREGEQIPLGTTIDTRKGRVTLFAAADEQGNTASADFYGGIFKVRQTRSSKPITRLILTEKLSCARTGKATTAARRKRKRRLWGSGRGRFRTEGQYSSATVRGTKWLVEDRCTSTLTRVVSGRVAVRDRVKKKTVIVRKGKRYIARVKKK